MNSEAVDNAPELLISVRDRLGVHKDEKSKGE